MWRSSSRPRAHGAGVFVAACLSVGCAEVVTRATHVDVELGAGHRCERSPGTSGEIDTLIVEVYAVRDAAAVGERCCACAAGSEACALVTRRCQCLDAPIDAVDAEAFGESFRGLEAPLTGGAEFCVRVGALDRTDEACTCAASWTAAATPDPVRVCGWTDAPFAPASTPEIRDAVYCRGTVDDLGAPRGERSSALVGCLAGGASCE